MKTNSIKSAQEALTKLQGIFAVSYPNEKCHFALSIDPSNGRYMLYVAPENRNMTNVFPEQIDRYRIFIEGISTFIPKGFAHE